MKVTWENEDLVEVIMSLKPAVCDIVSLAGEHLVLPILNLDQADREAISCQISSFLLSNYPCSVFVASFSKPDSRRVIDMYNGFWVTASVLFDTIQLSYRIIPKERIKEEIRVYIGNSSSDKTAP